MEVTHRRLRIGDSQLFYHGRGDGRCATIYGHAIAKLDGWASLYSTKETCYAERNGPDGHHVVDADAVKDRMRQRAQTSMSVGCRLPGPYPPSHTHNPILSLLL